MNHFDYPAEDAEEGVMMRDFGSLFSAPGAPPLVRSVKARCMRAF